MKYIFIGLSFFLITLIVNTVINHLSNIKYKNNKSVTIPKFVLIIGIISSVACLIPIIIVAITDYSLFVIIVFSLLFILGLYLIILSINYRITYNERYFEFRNFFGIKRRYSYDSITAISELKNTTLYIGKRKLSIEWICVGESEFISYVKKQYAKSNNGKLIPTKKPKSDIFNGNVDCPGEFLFIYILFGVILIGAIVFSIIMANIPQNIKISVLSFSSYKIVDDDMQLYTENNSLYFNINEYKELLKNPDNFIDKCKQGTKFEVTYTERDSNCFNVKNIIDSDGNIFLSAADVNKHNKKNAFFVIIFLLIMFIIWLIIVISSIYIGRYPEKFSKRVIRLFFKDRYVHTYKNKKSCKH